MNYKGKIAEAIVGVDIAGLPRFANVKTLRPMLQEQLTTTHRQQIERVVWQTQEIA